MECRICFSIFARGIRVDGDSEVSMLLTWWESCFLKREVGFRNYSLSPFMADAPV